MQTQSEDVIDPLYDEITPVIKGLGYTVVEFKCRQRQRTLHTVVIIHKDGGVNLEDCTSVHKAIYPRLEVLKSGVDIQLEVSSPGIYRKIKSPQEFVIFKGTSAKILLDGRSEWQKGTIGECSENAVSFITDQGSEIIDFSDIRKATLDYP